MSAETWVTISQVGVFLGAILAASGGAGSWYFGKIVERQKDQASTQQQIELNNKIESLIQGNSDLKKQLSPFEKIAERIYPAVERDDALKKLASDVDGMRQETQKLKQIASPRKLTDTQIAGLVKSLSQLKGEQVDLTIPMGDTEAFSYADQFKNAFLQAGMMVRGINQAAFTGPMPGLLISVPTENLSPKVNVFVTALRSSGLDIGGNKDASKSGTDIFFIVGSKN